MNIDKHILFLIVIIGIISAGIVGANVFSNDTSMKQEVFDGMTVSVPADSEFVKTGDGVYKDSNYGITIHTFKNNDTMVDYLKNSKKSKIIPVENQPPQSVAFKKGDKVSILVTNGNEGLSVTSKDGELTSRIANSIIFSNNHKSEKSDGLSIVKPHMNVKQDFNLIMLLIADVDTKIFNTAIFEENINVFVDDYNDKIDDPVSEDEAQDEDSGEYVSDVENSDDLGDILTDSDDSSDNQADSSDNSEDEDVAQTSVVDDSESDDVAQAEPADAGSSPADDSPASDDNTDSEPQEYSLDECRKVVEDDMELNNMVDYSIDSDVAEEDGCYVFFINDDISNTIVGNYTVDKQTLNFQFYPMP